MIVPSCARGPWVGPWHDFAQSPFPAHEPQNPRPASLDTLVSQARPDLAIAFAVEPALGDHYPDLPDQLRVGHRPLWPRAKPWQRISRCRLQIPVHTGPAQPPDPAYPRNAVSLARGDRDDGAHRFDLWRPKGRPASTFVIFSTRSSLSMVISSTLARRRSISSSRASRGRCFRFDTPPSRKASRQPLTSAAVASILRATGSTSSPRKTHRTASCFRAAVSLRRRAGAGSAAICEVSADPAPSRSTFFSNSPIRFDLLSFANVVNVQNMLYNVH